MSYVHYIHRPPFPIATVLHAKEIQSPSGLVTEIIHLGRTDIHGKPPELVKTNLHLPSIEEIIEFAGRPGELNPIDFQDRIESANLHEFELNGTRAIASALRSIGAVTHVTHKLAERRTITDGQIEHTQPQGDFIGYFADRDEIEIFERLASSALAKLQPNEPSEKRPKHHGVYL